MPEGSRSCVNFTAAGLVITERSIPNGETPPTRKAWKSGLIGSCLKTSSVLDVRLRQISPK